MRLSIEKGRFLCLPGRMFFLPFVMIFISAISMATAQRIGDDGVLSAPANFSSSIEECTTSIFGTSCTVSLDWTGVNAASGYKLYYGSSSGSYNFPVDLGNVTSETFYSVPEGTYYLAISAYDSNGNESNKSNEIALTVGDASVPTNFSATVSDCIDSFGTTSCTASLSWTGVSGSSGYYLYYGFSSGNYAGIIDVGDVDFVTYTGIVESTYYLALTAYDSEEVESGHSNEFILQVGSGRNDNGNDNDDNGNYNGNGNDNDDNGNYNGNDNDDHHGNDNDDNGNYNGNGNGNDNDNDDNGNYNGNDNDDHHGNDNDDHNGYDDD